MGHGSQLPFLLFSPNLLYVLPFHHPRVPIFGGNIILLPFIFVCHAPLLKSSIVNKDDAIEMDVSKSNARAGALNR